MTQRFLSSATFAAARRRGESGQAPFAAAWTHFLAAAEAALAQPIVHVRQNGGSPHFRQDAVYIPGRDGERNPASNMRSGELAQRAGSTALTLALAWQCTGESRYADRALQLIHAWCIDQNTRMFATGRVEDAWTPGAEYGGDIILFARLHGLFLAAYLLNDYPGWNLPARGAVKRWARAMVEPQRELMFYQGVEMYNNWEDARLLYLATGALFLDDVDLLLYVFDRWRHILPMKMTDEGELPRETMRTRSMHYTLFALDSTTQIAEIARQHGVDLYNYIVNGRGLKKAVDYATRYLLHMDQWPHQMIEPLLEKDGSLAHLGVFEMAYRQWQDPQYLQVLNTYGGRPVTGHHATLLYAEK